jgi:hypothetical protein
VAKQAADFTTRSSIAAPLQRLCQIGETIM